jgi:hypothetical protein
VALRPGVAFNVLLKSCSICAVAGLGSCKVGAATQIASRQKPKKIAAVSGVGRRLLLVPFGGDTFFEFHYGRCFSGGESEPTI